MHANFRYIFVNKKPPFETTFNFNLLLYLLTNFTALDCGINFHYAGPREAFHHMMIRQSLGFNFFYIGRDHAGAENLYPQSRAVKLVNKYKSKFKIKPFVSKGGFYCKKCEKYVIKGTCMHKNLTNISVELNLENI